MTLTKKLPSSSNEYLENLKPIFSKRLKAIREEKEYSQTHFSQILHVSRSCLAAWEKGSAVPDMQILIAICEILNVSADYMLGIIDEKAEFIGERDILEFGGAKYLDISKLKSESVYKLVDFYHSLIEKQ